MSQTKTQKKTNARIRRHKKVRSQIFGTAKKPRLAIFKSNKYLSAQIIDDEEGKTFCSVTTKGLKNGVVEAGEILAKKALELKLKSVVFDRGGFTYIGKIKDFAESARKAGLEF